MTLKITVRCAAFFCYLRSRPAAQLRGNIVAHLRAVDFSSDSVTISGGPMRTDSVASKVTPGDAKCVSEILGEGQK